VSNDDRMDVRFSPIGINKRILIFAAIVIGSVILLRPLQVFILERMERARDAFIGQVEDFLGRKIVYGALRPSFLGTLDIRDIFILREDGSEFLSVSRLRVSYSFFDLIRGNIKDSIKSVRIDRPVLSLDFQKDMDLGERLFPDGTGVEQNGASGFRELLPETFSIRIWDGEWELSDSVGSLKLNGVGLDASLRQNQISFEGQWDAFFTVSVDGLASFINGEAERVEGEHVGDAAPVTRLAFSPVLEAGMRGEVSGEYSGVSGEGSAVVTIPQLAGDFFRFNPLSFNVFLSDGRLEILKAYDRSPAALSLVYDLQNDSFLGRLEGENFSPSDFLSFTGSWQDNNSALAFRLSGNAVIEKESSEVPQFSVDFSGAGAEIYPENTFLNQASLVIKASGSADTINIDTFAIHSPNGGLDFRGGIDINPAGLGPPGLATIAPYGALSLSDFRLHGDRGISGDLYINTNGREIGVYSGNLSTGNVKLSSMDLSLLMENQGLDFVFSALGSDDINPPNNAGTPSISLTGSLDYEPRQVQVNLFLDSFPMGDIISFIEPLALLSMPQAVRGAADDLLLTTEVFFSTDYEHILYNAPSIHAAYDGFVNLSAVASLSGTDRGIEMSSCRVSFGNETAEIIGSADFSNIDDISFFLETSFGNLTYLFEGMIQDRGNISVRGSYGLQIVINSGPGGTYSGFARGDGVPIPSGIAQGNTSGFPGVEKYASLSFLFSLLADSPSSWRAAVERFELSGLTTPGSTSASLRFSGAANERGLSIPDLVFDDGRGTLSGNINIDWDAAYENYSFAMDIAGSGNGEIYSLAGAYRDKRLDFSLAGQRMQLGRFTARNATADISLKVSWESPESFEAEATVASFTLYRQSDVIRASANLSLNNDEFVAWQTRINYSGLEAYLPILKIDRKAADAETEIQISGRFSERPVYIYSLGKAAFNTSSTWIDLFRDFNYLDGSLNVTTARYDTLEAEAPFAFLFGVKEESSGLSMSLEGGPRNMVRLKYTPEAVGGAFYAALSAPSPVRGTFTGTIDSANIDARTTDLYVDVGSLWSFVPPIKEIAFPGGIITASVRVTGPLDEPEFYGSAQGRSMQILVPDFLPEPLRPVPFSAVLNGHEMTFGPVDTASGQGRGTVSGWFRFDQWIPDTFTMDVHVPQNSPLPFSIDLLGVIANGSASGDLVLAMEDFIVSITGSLEAQDTEISLNANELATLENSQGSLFNPNDVPTITDLSIRAGRRVEFFWPSADFPMLQASADLGTGIHVTSDSIAQRFTLNGDVKLRSGEIFYLERNFYLREGTLFFRENETSFDPFITARAEIRDQAQTGPVTISMMIDNAPLRSFTPRFVSSPTLSQIEIYSILGQNLQGGGDTWNIATSAVFDSLAQFAVIGRLQRQVRNFLGLDMLSLRTQLFQNMLIQVTGGRQSGSSTGREYRVGNYFDNTTVFIGKFFGADLFSEALFSFKYEENKLDWGGLVIEPEFGLEMRNPLFDIRFTMIPLHPENMFIDDVSFSIIWRRSF